MRVVGSRFLLPVVSSLFHALAEAHGDDPHAGEAPIPKIEKRIRRTASNAAPADAADSPSALWRRQGGRRQSQAAGEQAVDAEDTRAAVNPKLRGLDRLICARARENFRFLRPALEAREFLRPCRQHSPGKGRRGISEENDKRKEASR